MNQLRLFHQGTIFVVLPVLLLLSSCSSDGAKGEEGNNATVVDSTAIVAEMDEAITDYNAAAESLGVLLSQIKTVEDVETHAKDIRALGKRIEAFNEASIRYGNSLIERMELNPTGKAFERLREERERIQGMPEVAEKLGEVESTSTQEVK